jgi:glycosyltransferase involved in cell wall biosynthesis
MQSFKAASKKNRIGALQAAVSPYFDRDFYLAYNPDILNGALDPVLHYIERGEAEGRWPRADFNPAQVRAELGESLPTDAGNLLAYCARSGYFERRAAEAADVEAITPFFDHAFYLTTNADVRAAKLDPVLHYLRHGEAEGRWPRTDFNPVRIREELGKSLPVTQGNLFATCVRAGRFEREAKEMADAAIIAPFFHTHFYLTSNPDVGASGLSPILHYIRYGEAENRPPRRDFNPAAIRKELAESLPPNTGNLLAYCVRAGRFEQEAKELAEAAIIAPFFEADFYIASNPDIQGAQLDPVLHYVRHGEAEGRRPRKDFDPREIRIDLGENLPDKSGNLFAYCIKSGYFAQRQKEMADAATITPFFDRDFYLNANPELRQAGLDPVLHYLRKGELAGLRPCRNFDPAKFWQLLSVDEMVDAANLFVHFVTAYGADFSIFEAGGVTPPKAPAPPAPPAIVFDAQVYELANDIRDHFDAAYYLKQIPSAAESGLDPVLHYLTIGEKLGLNPQPGFDVNYYLDTNIDLKMAGISPFGHYIRHGRAERRSPSPYYKTPGHYEPLVSVIVPNYNHARFLEERFASIFEQSYGNLEVIVLDDCSTDHSIEIIEAINARHGGRLRTLYNETNSGSVFEQWRKGIALAKGELIWICESDDFCEPDFLQHMVAHFRDRSVMLAFGRIQFCDEAGTPQPGMDNYRERAWPGMWKTAFKRPAKEWYFECLGVKNVIANVGGCLFRKQELPAQVWQETKSYRIAGDWFLYSEIAGGGCIAYEPAAIAYFRQHGKNTSASNFRQPYYYLEHAAILRHLVKIWGLPARTRERFVEKIRGEYDYLKMAETGHAFEDMIPVSELMALTKQRRHLQFGSLGLTVGGGEVFPINLANLFQEAGEIVSMVCFDLHEQNPEIAGNLNSRIAIYDSADLIIEGQQTYLERRGIDLVNSHSVQIDHQFFSRKPDGPLPVPYICTLHGSHDVMDHAAAQVKRLLASLAKDVTAWIRVADKNLLTFQQFDLPPERCFKINNAMPPDTRSFPKTRSELGIDEDTVVFTFVARGIERKGWRASVIAFRELLRARPDAKIHLLLAGEGDMADESRKLVHTGEPITHLGFQSRINGLYRLSDCAIIPSRFAGESNPLCLIQAIQEGLPVIATDVGEIRNMLTLDDELAGLLLQIKRDTQEFASDLQEAMANMLDPGLRARLAAKSRRLAPKFDIQNMLAEYEAVFEFAKNKLAPPVAAPKNQHAA